MALQDRVQEGTLRLHPNHADDAKQKAATAEYGTKLGAQGLKAVQVSIVDGPRFSHWRAKGEAKDAEVDLYTGVEVALMYAAPRGDR